MAENNVEVKFTAQDVMSAIIGGINKAFAAMTGASQTAGEAVAGVAESLDEAATSNNLLGNAIKAAWDGIIGTVAAAGKKIGETLKGMGQNLNADGLKQGLSTFSTAAGTAVELVKTKVEIALIAFVTGVSAAVLTVGYAAYKSVSAIVGLFTGSFYKSENIDAVIAMNKEITGLQKTFGITAVQAGALNDAMRRLGVDSAGYADVHAKVTDALRGNSAALDAMGVKYKDVNGKLLSNREVLQNAKAMLDTYTEGWDRNQAALALGLGTYDQINQYLRINQEELQKSKKRLDEYYLAMGPEAQKFIADYQKAMLEFNNELKLSGDSLMRVFADQVIPAYTELAKLFNDGWPSIVNGTRHVLAAFTSLGYGLKMSFDVMYDTTTGITKAVLAGLGAIAAGVAFAIEGDWKNAAKSLINGFDDALAKVKGIRDTVAEDAEKNLKAMQLAQGKFSQSSVENDKKIAEGRKFKKDVAVAADEEEVYSLQELARVQEDYYKSTGNSSQAWLARREQERLKELDDVETHYNVLEQQFEGNASTLAALAKMKATALQEIDTKHSRDKELAQIANNERALAHQKESDNALIAAIKARIATHELTEEEGSRQILQIQQRTTQAMLEEAKKRVESLSKSTPNSEEYAKAVGAVKRLEGELSGYVEKQATDRDKYHKQSMDNMLSAAQSAYQADLNSLQEAENNKTISAADAALKRLKIDRDYADQVASMRAKELTDAAAMNDPAAYAAALKAKLDADKAYLAAKQAVTTEEAKILVKQTKDAVNENNVLLDEAHAKADKNFKDFKQQLHDLGAAWFSMWNNAYNEAASSLQGLSEAAYNAFAEIEGLPLKSAATLDTLKKKAEEAAVSYGKLYRQAQDAGLSAGAAWADAVTRLNLIPAEAARITAEYYKQKVAAEELALALDKPAAATGAFVQQAERAVSGLNLLDKASLDTIEGKINGIKDAMLAFTDRVRDALKSLQNEFDNLTMSKVQLEEKRYNEEKLKWQQDYQTAQQQNNEDAIKALRKQLALIEEIHKIKVADLQSDPANSKAPVYRAVGGWIPGVGSGDTVPAMLTPGEYVIRKAAASYWGGGIMAAINNPFGQFGRELQGRIAGLAASLPSAPALPKLAYATGGPAVQEQQRTPMVLNFNITATQQVDETFIRRKIIPEIERVARLRA